MSYIWLVAAIPAVLQLVIVAWLLTVPFLSVDDYILALALSICIWLLFGAGCLLGSVV